MRWTRLASAVRTFVVASTFALPSARDAIAQTPAHVAVLHADPGGFDAGGLRARAFLAQEFFRSHTDAYDFLILFPAFRIDFSARGPGETLGKHWFVRNGVSGIGVPSTNNGPLFSSARTLQGVVDVHSLVPGISGNTVDVALGVVVHEIAHQWSSYVSFRDPRTGARSSALLGEDATHWSYFLDSSASVMYGSAWRDAGNGRWVSEASRKRYSPLDLYLMGMLDASEVPSFRLLVPGPGAPQDASALPPRDGTSIDASAVTLSIADIVAAEGPRSPAAASTQRVFRAAFAIVMPPGVDPTAGQLAFVDEVRRASANEFFFMTRGRGVIETDLVEPAPAALAANPSLQLGVSFLVGAQRPDGSWGSGDAGTVRETQAALEALTLFRTGSATAAALGAGVGYLSALQPRDVDTSARRDLGARAGQPGWNPAGPALHDLSRANPDGGLGLVAGYQSTVLDTALALVGTRGALSEAIAAATEFLLQAQNGDGGWSPVVHGASDIATTALVLNYLSTVPRSTPVSVAAEAALGFLTARRAWSGDYLDDLSGETRTAEAVLALDAWQRLGSTHATETRAALLAAQRADGSWNGSTHRTALALRALRCLALPDLSIAADEATLTHADVTEGETVQARVIVRNVGHADASQVTIQAFDESRRPFGPAIVVPSVAAGGPVVVDLSLDTVGHAGAAQVFLVVDPDGLVEEIRKDNNRAAVGLAVAPRPLVPDLFVAAGSLTSDPRSISRAGTPVTVTARVGNVGRTEVPAATVALIAGTTSIATATLPFPGASAQAVALAGVLPPGAGFATLRVVVDPENAVSEVRKDNNSAVTVLAVVPTVDLRVAQVSAAPSPVEQGRDVAIQFSVANRGTADAPSTLASVSILDGAGTVVATLPSVPLSVPSGGSATGQVAWRASTSAAVAVRVEAPCAGDLDPSDNAGVAALSVNPSGLSNLRVAAGGISTSPSPLLEARPATIAATVRNAGSAAGPFVVDFWSGDPASGGTRVGRVAVAGLAAGEETVVSVPFTPSSAGRVTLVAVVDPENQVAEFDESDNRAVLAADSVSRPDLGVTSGDVEPQTLYPAAGSRVVVTVGVGNLGGQASGPAAVQLYQGPPEAGGALIGSTVIAAVAGNGRGSASFVWDTTGLTGAVNLVALVNADRSADEARYDNDRGERTVMIQSGPLALSEPYFSPDGDGVKDTTVLFYRLERPAVVEAAITDRRGRVVQKLASSSSAITGSITWDGRSAAGTVVRDGVYRLTVTAGETVVGAIDAVVDTNRAALLDVEPSLHAPVDLAASARRAVQTAPEDRSYGFVVGATPDEEAVVFAFRTERWQAGVGYVDFDCGLLRVPLDGADAIRLTPADWLRTQRCFDEGAILTPDGRSVVWAANASGLKRLDLATQAVTTILSETAWSPVVSSPDGATVFFGGNGGLEAVGIDGTNHRIVGPKTDLEPLSPDRTQLLTWAWPPYVNYHAEWNPGKDLRVAAIGGAGARTIVIGTRVPACLEFADRGELRICARVAPTPIPTPPLAVVLPKGRQLGTYTWVSNSEIAYVSDRAYLRDSYRPDARQELYLLDLPTGVATLVYAVDSLSPWANGSLGTPVADPAGDDLVFTPSRGGTETWAVSTEGGAPWRVFDWAALGGGTGSWFNFETTFSGAGAFLYTRDLALGHLGNLSVQVTAYRRPSTDALTFRGTVADVNLESWELTARRHGSAQPPVVVARSTSMVVSGELAVWTPPAPGTWEATLTARDRAGNVRSASAMTSFAEVPAIANLSLAPRYISPNGDGVQDAAAVSYSVQEPVSTELVVHEPSGAPVRIIPVSHASTGTYSLSWDGRDDGGTVVADGAYEVRIASQSRDIVVDRTPPTATLRGVEGTPDHQFAAKLFDYRVVHAPDGDCPAGIPLTERQLRAMLNPQKTVMGLVVRAPYRAYDDNLLDYSFESATSQPPSEYRPLLTGSVDVATERDAELPLWLISGDQVRLRARDLAGNVSTTAPLAIPENTWVMAWGPGQSATMCSGSLEIRELGSVARSMPGMPAGAALPAGLLAYRRSLLPNDLLGPADPTDAGFCFEPAFYGFWIESTVRQPIAAASIAWKRESTDDWVVDQTNVALTPWNIVTWDARSVPQDATIFELRFLDASGRTFVAPVPGCGSQTLEGSSVEALCPSQSGNDLMEFAVRTREAPGSAPSARLALRDSETRAYAPLSLTLRRESDPYVDALGLLKVTREYVARLNLNAVEGCRYDVIGYPGLDGKQPEPYWSFDACGVRAEHVDVRGDVAVMSLGARFHKPISSIDLFLGSGSSAVYARTIPGFQRVSEPFELNLGDRACGVKTRVTATVHFADGTTWRGEVAAKEDDHCGDEEIARRCMKLHVATSRGITPLCAGQPADYQLSADATSDVSFITTLALQARPLGSLAPTALFSSPVTPGRAVSTGTTFGTSGFSEGTWMIDAVATDDTGATARSGLVPVVVNRTAPRLRLDAPAQGGTVCPVQLSDGSRAVRVDGTVSDPALEEYSFLLHCGANEGPLLPVQRVALQGALGAFRVLSGNSVECQLALEARNAGGGSWCTAPVRFRVMNGAGVTVSPDQRVFSPNGDGVADVLTVHVGLREPATVTLTATDAAGRSGVVWQGALPMGSSAVSWDGRIGGEVAAEGAATLRVDAVDGCGIPATARAITTVDATPPIARIDTPVAGTRIGASARVSGEVSDDVGLDRYELSIGAGVAPVTYQLVATSENATSGFLGAVPTSALPDGVYTVRLWARDLAGNEASTAVQIVVAPKQLINTFAVLPALVSPNGDGLSDVAIASFQLLGAADVSLDLLDASGAVVMGLVPVAPAGAGQTDVPIAWTTLAALATDGAYQARLTASAAGLVETETAPLEVDRARPEVALRAPSDGSAIPGAADVVGTVSDTHLESWTLTLAAGTAGATVAASGRSPIAGNLVRLEDLPEGDYRMRLEARDRAGNAAHADVAFASDTTAPVVALVAPGERAFVSGLQTPVRVEADVHDAHLAGVRLAVTHAGGSEHEVYAGAAFPPGGVPWDLSGASDGAFDVELVATDTAGNLATVHRAVTVDRTLPVAAISSPRDTFLRAGEAIRGTATDANLASWSLELASGPPTLTAMWFPLAAGTRAVWGDVLADLASLPADGVYALRLTVTDEAGNTSHDTAGFVVDTTPPRPPTALAAQVVGRDVRLTWQPSPDADVVAYQAMRVSGATAAVPLGSPAAALASVDVGPPDGTYRYVVVAIDAAGLRSDPSAPASVTLDRVAPLAVIDRPGSGATVSGVVRVTGTAWRASRFKEFRVSVGDGAAPASFTLLRRSGLPITQGELASIDFGAYADGSEQTVRLEAEDLNGNVAEARVTVRVDATPPGAPRLVSAMAGGTAVALAWEPPAEADVAGYLLYRNGAIVNAPSGTIPSALSAYRLPPTSLAYTDAGLPDGTYTYEVQAFDLAGNASALSNALTVTLETHPPHAVITAPAALSRITGPVDVVAEAPDQDVASVQFYARDGSGGALRPIGGPVLRVPFTARLDPAGFTGPAIELRAVATDRSGNVDPSPASLYLFAAGRPLAPVASARVAGDQVDLSWTDPNAAGSVSGYEVARDGSSVVPAPGRPTGVASSSDPTSSPGQAYDGLGYTGWYTTSAQPAWQLDLTAPVLTREVDVSLAAQAEIDVSVNVRGAWIPVHHAVESGTVAVSLGDGLEILGCRIAFLASPSGLSGLDEVTISPIPLALPVSLRDGPVASGDHTYAVRAVTPLGLRSVDGEAAARIYAPVLDPPQAVVGTTPLAVTGRSATPGATIAVLRGAVQVGSAQAASDGTFSADVGLIDGDNVLVAQATDARGNASLASPPVTTTYDAAPPAVIALSLTGVSGSDVALSFTASGDTSRVAGYRLTRATSGTSIVRASLGPTERAVVDRAVPNGTHDYAVVAVNAHGLEGPRSNLVTALVAVPVLPAPTGLAVSSAAPGSALRLDWEYAGPVPAGFLVERALSPSGPFAATNAGALVPGQTYFDRGLTPGVPYHYRVLALDGAGNASAYSNVATGTPTGATVAARPRIVAPTRPGRPIASAEAATTVAGLADPHATVELYRNGTWLAVQDAGAVEFAPARYVLSTPGGVGAVSPDGATIARPRGAGLLLEGRLGSFTVTDPTLSAFGAMAFSPDGANVAFEATSALDGRRHVWIARAADGTLTRIAQADGEERAPAWSPDGTRLAYLATRSGSSNHAVGVTPAVGGSERLLWRSGSDVAGAVFGAGDAIIAIASMPGAPDVLVRFDLATAAARDLASSADGFRDLVVGPAGDLAAVSVAGADPHVALVDVSSGVVSRISTSGVPVRQLAFVRNATALAWFTEADDLVEASLGGPPRVVGNNGPSHVPDRVVPTARGLFAFHASGQVDLLDWGGRFTFENAALVTGDNEFVVVATDAAGRRSEPSEPISVALDPFDLPDLAVTATLFPELPVAGDPSNASVTVSNQGGARSVATTLEVRVIGDDGSVRLAKPVPIGVLRPGASTTALVPLELAGLAGAERLVVTVDPEARVVDPDRSNNTVDLAFRVAEARTVGVAVAAVPATVAAGGTTVAQVVVTNPGLPLAATVRTRIADASGTTVGSAPDATFAPLPGGAATTVTRSLAVGTALAGPYQIVAEVLSGGAVIATASAPITVRPERAASLTLAASRATYVGAEAIELEGRVENRSSNAQLSGASYAVEVVNAAGTRVFAATPVTVPPLWIGAQTTVITGFSAGALAPGTYRATASVVLDATALATGSVSFAVLGEAAVRGSVFVSGAGDPPVVPHGHAAVLAYHLENHGNAATSGLAARIVVVDPDTANVITTSELIVPELPPAQSASGEVRVPTAALGLKRYAAVLVADHDGLTGVPIATGRFRVVDSAPPLLSVQNLSSGMVVRGAVAPVVHATDDYAGTSGVRVSIDGGPPSALTLVSGIPLDGVWTASIAFEPDGAHTLVFSATDAEGNDGLTAPAPGNPIAISVISDTAPPVVSIEGVAERACYATPVTPVATATDVNLAVLDARLDGAPLRRGTPVSADGDHTFVAQATDRAGNQASASVRFVVDGTAPRLAVAGVIDGSFVATSVAYAVTVDEAHPAGLAVTLNGAAAATAAVVDADGLYTLAVHSSDCAGNLADAAVAFTIDTVAPVVTISGVAEASYVRGPVTPTWAAADANLASVLGSVNGAPFASGASISSDGNYLVEVVATDRAGNRTPRSVAFVVDASPPAIQISGFGDGSYVSSTVYPSFTVTDTNLAHVEATLDGSPFLEGMAVTAEGLHVLVITAGDRAGNEASRTAHFTIDRTPPAITLTGFSEGSVVTGTVTIGYTATDSDLASVAGLLDRGPFSSGIVVTAEGAHVVTVRAVDLAGNDATLDGHFAIDNTPPRVVISGIADGQVTAASVTPVVAIDDANLATSTVTLDGAAFRPGTIVSAEGDHVVAAAARDAAGLNASATVRFSIDRTPPRITITGAVDGGMYASGVAPTIEVSDAHLSSSRTALDGVVYVSGTPILAAGPHVLSVTAQDAAGNPSSAVVAFTVDGEMTCPAPETLGPRVPVYEDALMNCFEAATYWGGYDLASPTVAHAGTRSIAFDPQDWAALRLERTGLRSSYGALEFWVNGGAAGGQRIVLEVRSGEDRVAGSVELASLLGGPIPAETWSRITVPFRMPTAADDLSIWFKMDGKQGAVYFDDIALLAETAGSCTGARGQPCSDGDACNGVESCDGAGTCIRGVRPAIDDRNPCTDEACDPVAGVSHVPSEVGRSCFVDLTCGAFGTCDGAGACLSTSAVRDVRIYDDAIGVCFEDFSVPTAYDPNQLAVIHGGAHAIRFVPLASDEAVFMAKELGASFDAIELWIHGGDLGGQALSVHAEDSAGALYDGLFSDVLGEPIAARTWERVRIPFARGSQPGWIYIAFHAVETGGTVYLDDIRLVRNSP